jgi:hypothetical protein
MNIAFTLLPRGSDARVSVPGVAGVTHWLARAGATVRQALEASGQARARRHLQEFADQCEALQPDLAKELRAAMARDPVA